MEAVAKQRAERAEQQRKEDLMRPGRDAIEPMLGPEAGLAMAGRQALSSAGRGLLSAMERRAAAEGVKRTAKEEAKKEPTFKKGGSVRGGGCEARSKKTRYV